MIAFTTRGSSKQLPSRTCLFQEQLRLQRKAVFMEAREDPNMTNLRVMLQELHRGRKGRNMATGSDGVTYIMLEHARPAGHAALLAKLNASWLDCLVLPAWKEADIQPNPKPREPTKFRAISLLSCSEKKKP